MGPHQAAGIAPDLVCSAKTLAGGMLPLAATLAARTSPPRGKRPIARRRSSWALVHRASTGVRRRGGELEASHITSDRSTAADGVILNGASPVPELPHVARCARGSIAAIELNVAGGYLADVGRQLRLRCLADDVLLRPLGSVLCAAAVLHVGCVFARDQWCHDGRGTRLE